MSLLKKQRGLWNNTNLPLPVFPTHSQFTTKKTKTATIKPNTNKSRNSSSTSITMLENKPENYNVNAKICRLVEQYPCMYDRSHPSYLKKDVVDLAWIAISKEMNDSSKYTSNNNNLNNTLSMLLLCLKEKTRF